MGHAVMLTEWACNSLAKCVLLSLGIQNDPSKFWSGMLTAFELLHSIPTVVSCVQSTPRATVRCQDKIKCACVAWMLIAVFAVAANKTQYSCAVTSFA